MHDIFIVIPARYKSTRLPGKPLELIDGIPLLKRVSWIAEFVCKKNDRCRYSVATDSDKVMDFCLQNDIPCMMTPEACKNGTERCWETVRQLERRPDLVVNLQGDNVLCQAHIIQNLIDAWKASLSDVVAKGDVFTPAALLTWEDLEKMEESKKKTPFSGTTVEVTRTGKAMCFSKKILPDLRKRQDAREAMGDFSPVRRHFGLYAYTYSALEEYQRLPESPYETSYTEGLEQNRFTFNERIVRVIDVDTRGYPTTSGVDSREDIERVEEIVRKHGWFNLIY